MKITILLSAVLISASSVFAQTIEIVSSSDMSTDLSGTTIEVEDDANEIAIYSDFRVINTGTQSISVKYNRKRDYNSGRLDQICDNSICYDADDTYSFTSPSLNTINPGESSVFKPQILPAGMESCAVHSYYVVTDFGQVLDSITVVFKTTNATCNLSVDKANDKKSLSVYPNPAQDYIHVEGDMIKNGGTIVFLDALGKEVKQSVLSSNNSKVAISELKRGVYFVNVYGQNGIKSDVQRLVIQ